MHKFKYLLPAAFLIAIATVISVCNAQMKKSEILTKCADATQTLPPRAFHVETSVSFIKDAKWSEPEINVLDVRKDVDKIDCISERYSLTKEGRKKELFKSRSIWSGEQLIARQNFEDSPSNSFLVMA